MNTMTDHKQSGRFLAVCWQYFIPSAPPVFGLHMIENRDSRKKATLVQFY